jgi:hypothetical protein
MSRSVSLVVIHILSVIPVREQHFLVDNHTHSFCITFEVLLWSFLTYLLAISGEGFCNDGIGNFLKDAM